MAVVTTEQITPVRQNWIISPNADVALIIAAPILWFLWAVVFNFAFGPEVVVATFLGFNVGHHLPTFIRIYGDKDLLKRFRYSLLLGPILPFSAAMGVSAYVIQNDLPFANVLFLLLILTIWDPWHFLMQHFGFMRIYDRNNKAPRKLAGRMDLAISATWFAHIMIAATAWLPGLLYQLYNYHALPVARFFAGGAYAIFEQVTLALALGMTVIYIGYLFWCRLKGYYISPAKLMMLSITLGMTYFTYVPNTVMQRMQPDWTFALGFAALGMVHVTQYLAIVWKYNRMLASRMEPSRGGMFRKFFSRGGVKLGLVYLFACLLYGYTLYGARFFINEPSMLSIIGVTLSKWLLALVFSISFTSTLLHYYYDGFIWKIRHKENQKNLDLEQPATSRTAPATPNPPAEPTQEKSWWDASREQTILGVGIRQACYFLIPAFLLWATYLAHRVDAQYRPQGEMPLASLKLITTPQQARETLEALKRQAEVEEMMIQIRPLAHHYTYLAELKYAHAVATYRYEGFLIGIDAQRASELQQEITKAIQLMETGLALPGPYKNPEHTEWTRSQFEEMLARWQQEKLKPSS